MWDRDPTVQEIETKRQNVTVFDGSHANAVMNTLEYIFQKIMKVMKELILIKTGMKYLARIDFL